MHDLSDKWSGFNLRQSSCLIVFISPHFVKYLEALEFYIRPVPESSVILVSDNSDTFAQNKAQFQNFTKNIYQIQSIAGAKVHMNEFQFESSLFFGKPIILDNIFGHFLSQCH